MNNQLPFFNWSLKKALDSEPDSFSKARLRIVFAILIFSILKGLIIIGFGIFQDQSLQVVRAVIAVLFYLVMSKALLYQPSKLMLLGHITIWVGYLIVCSNIFVYAHKLNLVTIQFIFMIILSSYYILGRWWGTLYSFISIIPVTFALVFPGSVHLSFSRDGQEFPSPGYEILVMLNFISIIVSHYLFYQALAESISEKEKLNRELQLSVAEANKLAESRSNFLSTISHELRTPLNSVIGIAELLSEDKPEDRQKENLRILRYSALDLLSLINNVLDFNKIDSDKLELETIPFHLAEFMENICLGLKLKANDKQIDFKLEIDPQLKYTNVLSDPTRLSQIIYNLASNAIKFTDSGTVTICLQCVSKVENTAEVLFSVTDTGIGIHPERHEKIFDLFTQAESHITRKYGGTGLGLAIVKQLLPLFKSAIQMESSPGKGTRFFFTIVFTTTADMPGKETTSPVYPDFSDLKVLVAEDNVLNRMIVKKQFETMKVKPVLTENGKQGYEAFIGGDFDVVFIDLHMPEIDGFEMAKMIRAQSNPANPVYLLAFTASVNEQQKIIESGFDGYLYKPVEMNALREKLSEIAAHRLRLGSE